MLWQLRLWWISNNRAVWFACLYHSVLTVDGFILKIKIWKKQNVQISEKRLDGFWFHSEMNGARLPLAPKIVYRGKAAE